MTWSEMKIARAIALQTLARKCVVLVDRCNWTGHECDVLAVTNDLRIIDVEVKISRSDFKADAAKDKWWHRPGWLSNGTRPDPVHRDWPPKVWKHYYVLPEEIWDEKLLPAAGSESSGILLIRDRGGRYYIHCHRRARPNRDAARLTPADAVDVARLANLRMWDAYARLAA